MKLCYSTLACPNWTLEQIVCGAVDAGLQGIDFRGLGTEIDITKTAAFTGNLPATLALLRKNNLEVPCLHTSVILVTPGAERWQEMLEEFQRYARLAAHSRTPYVRVFAGSGPKQINAEESLSLAKRHLRQLVKIAQASGCMPLLETHDVWSTSESVLAAIQEFLPDEAGVLWDIEHTCRKGEAPRQTAQALKRYVRHVHFKDSVRRDGKSVQRLLGEGDIPLDQCMSALRAMGYEGWICLESEKRWQADAAEPEISLPQFAHYMCDVLGLNIAAPAPSQARAAVGRLAPHL